MKKGFTLAEVLITLAIIGVVAALTIPTLVANYQKKSLETQVTKFYSQMLNAVKLHMADEGVDKVTQTSLLYLFNGMANSENIDTSKQMAYNFLHKYFKVVKDCEQMTDCFAESYSSVDGSESSEPRTYPYDSACVVLADGISVCLFPGDQTFGATVQFDINGKKGPNKAGYDYFTFTVFYDGSINESISPECRKYDECVYFDNANDTINSRFEDGCKSANGAQYGAGCFAKFLDNGFKMDY